LTEYYVHVLAVDAVIMDQVLLTSISAMDVKMTFMAE